MSRAVAARVQRARDAVARREVSEAVASNARAIRNLADPDLKAMLPVLREAEREAASELGRWLRSVNGADTYTGHHHRAVLYQLRKAIDIAERKLGPAAMSDLTIETRRAAAVSLVRLRMMVEKGSLQFEGAVRPLGIGQAAILERSGTTLMEQHRSSARRYAGNVGVDIRRRLAIGMLREETVDQMTARLMGGGVVAARRRGPGAVADGVAERLFYGMPRADAERLVTTEVVHAYNFTHQLAFDELEASDPGYRKIWDAANDLRVCAMCRAMDGEVTDIHGAFKNGMRFPPAHPRCRCGMRPWRLEWGTVERLSPAAA